jgi:hypothetical protein
MEILMLGLGLYLCSIAFNNIVGTTLYYKFITFVAKKGYKCVETNNDITDNNSKKNSLIDKISQSKALRIIPIVNLIIPVFFIVRYILRKEKMFKGLKNANLVSELSNNEIEALEKNDYSLLSIIDLYAKNSGPIVLTPEEKAAKTEALSEAIMDKICGKNLSDEEVKVIVEEELKKLFPNEEITIDEEGIDKFIHDMNEKFKYTEVASDGKSFIINAENLTGDFKEKYVDQYATYYPEVELLDKQLRRLNVLVVDARKKTNDKEYIDIKYIPYIKQQMADIIIAAYNNDISGNNVNGVILLEIVKWYPELMVIPFDEDRLDEIIKQMVDVLKQLGLYEEETLDNGYSKKID